MTQAPQRQLDYALIGNCQVSALVDREARYIWSCLPRFDSPSIFASLLGGESAGFWSCRPENDRFETRQRYLRNTNVVQTEFHLPNGDRFDVIDFAPRFAVEDKYYHAPRFIRILRPVKGNPRVCMRLEPRFEYGKIAPQIATTGDGLTYTGAGQTLHLETDASVAYLAEGRSFELKETRYFVLSHGTRLERPLKVTCEEFYDRTVAYWRTWVKHCNIPFEYQDAVIRSALALKLHIFEDTGAIIAATTTSLPESLHGNRTWDYRYCWLRDSYFVISGLNQLGQFDEMEHFIDYLHNIAASESVPSGNGFAINKLQPVYGISGERNLHESEVPWLDGFRGVKPVRIGNAAYTHDQFDVYGEMVLAVAPLFFDTRLGRVDLQRAFTTVVQLVEKAIATFDKADAGIWEFRSDGRHYLFSKILSWAAVDRGVKIAERMGRHEEVARWRDALGPMRKTIEDKGWNEEVGYYTQSLGDEAADASNLLMIGLRFHPPGHPRLASMVNQYEKILMDRGFMFRYRNADDFGVPCNAFTICTFWMVDALASLGRKDEARAIFEKVLASANHVGLLSEDVDPATGELWGNFPQTYSHVGIINSAFRLSKTWDEAF